jgi:putative PIN family toxin of toxin-antitoxin system
MEAAREGSIQLITCGQLLVELEDVLGREKFLNRLQPLGITPHELVVGYGALASVIPVLKIPQVIEDDPDDDVVLACAVDGNADAIVSGDSHLLSLSQFQAVRVYRAVELLNVIAASE